MTMSSRQRNAEIDRAREALNASIDALTNLLLDTYDDDQDWDGDPIDEIRDRLQDADHSLCDEQMLPFEITIEGSKSLIDSQVFRDLFTDANVHIHYWGGGPVNVPRFPMKIVTEDDSPNGVGIKLVSMKDAIKGVQIMAEKYPRHARDLVANNADSITSDVAIQCAVFGEIIYS